MYLALIGLILGAVMGIFIPYSIPMAYSKYMAVAILACLDSVFGGYAASVQGKFDMKIFISGFFGNALLAAGLAFIGDKLGADIYMAAVFAFGNRMFINFAIIRRYLLNK
ncbi:MAG: small basic family protein [Deltaproteobacteria bacterium]